MTPATIQALNCIRDLSMLKWYVIPLLAIVMYIYTKEIKDAKKTGNWDAVFSGLAVFGTDFFNETWNGWGMVLSGHSALWTTPGDTALRTLVGWNIEIMFMFSIGGIIFYHTLSVEKDAKIFGLPDKWFWAVVFSVFCVFVECILNKGGHLVWEYAFWYRSFAGVWLVFLAGYFIFFCASIWAITRETITGKIKVICFIYSVPVVMNIIGFGIMGWTY